MAGNGLAVSREDIALSRDPEEKRVLREASGRLPPFEIRQNALWAGEALNAFRGGQSIPSVALNYRYEPGQAELFLRSVVREYGPERLRGVVPAEVLTTLAREAPGFVDREAAARRTAPKVDTGGFGY